MSPRYLVKGKIGSGGLGEVYLATDAQLGRDVALKRVKPPESGSADILHQDLIREARTLSALQHPNIVTIYDVGQDNQGPFVVMEHLKGETLDEVIARGAMTVSDFKEVVVQTLEGMIAAQELGLVHRDLKPGNLMVVWLASGKFQIKILDFGLAKFSVTATRQTEDQESGIMGSIYFMAPEQFERLPLDGRTDMYSLGCIFYQILTTHYPFGGQTGPEVMVSHLQHHVRHLVQARTDLPMWLADWVMWLISRDMEDRPANARIALDYFRKEKSGLRNPTPDPAAAGAVKILGRGSGPVGVSQRVSPATGSHPSTPGSQKLQGTAATSRSSRPAAKKVPKKHTGLWVFLTILLLAAGAGATWWRLRPQPPAPDPRAPLLTIFSDPNPAPHPATLRLLFDALDQPGPDATRAAGLLKQFKGEFVAEAVASRLRGATGDSRMVLIDILSAHPSKAGSAQLIRIAAEESGPLRIAAIGALSRTSGIDGVPDLLDLLPKIKDDPSRNALISTITSLLAAESDSSARARPLIDALAKADNATRPPLLSLLSSAGGTAANRALADEIANPGDRRNAALAVIKDWQVPYPVLADALLTAAAAPTDRNALIAAYCHVAPLISKWTGEDLVASLRSTRPLVETSQNRAAFCRALSGTASPDAAAFARELAADPAWQAAASAAADRIGTLRSRLTPLAIGKVTLDAANADILSPESDAYFTATSRYITNWKNPGTRLAWDVSVSAPVTVSLQLLQSTSQRGDRRFRVRLGEGKNEFPVQPTESLQTFKSIKAGQYKIPRAGTWRLWLEPARMEPGQVLFNVREITASVSEK